MNTESSEDAAVANAANWLRLIFHSLTCNNPACVLEDRCAGGKQLLTHLLCCANPGACAAASCTSVRRLTLHWLRCQEPHCRLCAGVWRDLSGYDEAEAFVGDATSEQVATQAHPSPGPEAPGTPDRYGLMAQANGTVEQDTDQYETADFSARGVDAAAATRPPPSGMDAAPVQQLDVIPGPGADRAVVQLQEATSYMRYVLHGLMCRYGREAASRTAGHQFWLSVLLPAQEPEGAEAARQGVAPPPAGRRLLLHRLTCRNQYCALCAGTCELFTRGNALRRELPPPNALGDMDAIVEELSLALGSVNL